MQIQSGPENDLKTVNIEIPNDVDNLGILLSGGTDSAILLYLVAKENLNHNKKIIPFVIPKHDGAAFYATTIITYVNIQLGTEIPIPTYVGDPDLPHDEILYKTNRKILSDYKSIALFVGENQNPQPEHNMPGLHPIRATAPVNRKIIKPFLHLYKYHIIDLYYKFNQQELIKITHSCTQRKYGRCKQCFQCSEREWAFRILERNDLGSG